MKDNGWDDFFGFPDADGDGDVGMKDAILQDDDEEMERQLHGSKSRSDEDLDDDKNDDDLDDDFGEEASGDDTEDENDCDEDYFDDEDFDE